MKKLISIWVALFTLTLQADVSIFVDLSKGMSNDEFKELIKLTFPKKHSQDTIYKKGEKVHLYAFKGTHSLKKDFTYYPSDVDEKRYKKAKKQYMRFFSKVKKSKKPPKKKRISANVVFVVDTSGSMVNKHHNYLSAVKKAMKELVRNKSKKAKVSIVTFDGKKKMRKERRSKIIVENETDKKKLFAAIDSIQVSRYDTFLGSGLQKASNLLPRKSKRKNVVMIFTDGAEVNDYDTALQEVESLKKNGVSVKVVAVGGADVEMLKNFSSSKYVFNATKADLQTIIKDVSLNTDEIVLRLDDFLSMSPLKNGDRFVLYSTMENVDNISDFSLVPNVSSKIFYDEFEKQNEERDIVVDFNGARVFVRVTGDASPAEIKRLKTFWTRYFKAHNAKLRYFSASELQKSEVR